MKELDFINKSKLALIKALQEAGVSNDQILNTYYYYDAHSRQAFALDPEATKAEIMKLLVSIRK